MKIKNLEIGPDKPCRIIAELGTLHLSSYRNLLAATREAVNAGADMVKIQLINPESAFWATPKQRKRYKRLDKPLEFWEAYFKEANEIFGTPVFSSIFDPKFFGLNFFIPAWKLGYRGLYNPTLLKGAFKSQKPLIVSLDDGGLANESFQNKIPRSEALDILVQYVRPRYPVPDEEIRLPLFGAKFQGLSIHSQNMDVMTAAIMLGAQTLEVHVKGKEAEGPDTSFALTMKQLSELVRRNACVKRFKEEIKK